MCAYECGMYESGVFEDVHGVRVCVVGEDVCMRWCV